MKTYSRTIQKELYERMYLIRRAEETIRELYPEDEMKTPVHLSIGEEAIAAGVVGALGPKDQIFGSYRSHGIYLARAGETDKFFAELYGKRTGLVRGKAGSMHLSAPERGLMGTSAIVGSIIPVAAGAAYANKVKRNGKVVVVFFGDGATEEGAFWEALNVACLMKLPVLFVCEDNELAVCTPKQFRRGYRSIVRIVSGFDCGAGSATTTDVDEVYRLTKRALAAIRKTARPFFLHLRYYRYLEHVGVREDFDCGYRSKGEYLKWLRVDPLKLQRAKLLSAGTPERAVRRIETRIDAQIARSVRLAKKAPFPDSSELCEGLYGCGK